VRGMITAVNYLLDVTADEGMLEKKPNPMRAKRRAGMQAKKLSRGAPAGRQSAHA